MKRRPSRSALFVWGGETRVPRFARDDKHHLSNIIYGAVLARPKWLRFFLAFFSEEGFVLEESDQRPSKREEIIEIHAVGMPERKPLGEAVEAVFLATVTMLGFPVLKPWGDSRPYDFAVEGRRRLWKVQVKCATSHRGTRCDAKAAGSSGELYTLEDIDFLAAYVIKENLWYVVPADAFVPRATVHFNYGPRSQGMFEKYREAWCLLECSEKARGRADIPKRCRCEELAVRCAVCPKRR